MMARSIKRMLTFAIVTAMMLSFAPAAALAADTADPLSISDAVRTELTVTLDGTELDITQYEDVYVANPTNVSGEAFDMSTQSSYPAGYTTASGETVDQGISIYVPSTATKSSPILFIVNNAGWQSDSYAERTKINDGDAYVSTSDTDKIGAALKRGFVIVSYGCRSRSDAPDADGNYLGHSPATVTDTKAAIRYLRYNADALPAGDTELIFVNGTSGGGGLTTIIASSGNSADYYESLYEIGAAGIVRSGDSGYADEINDDIFGAIAYCPINDLGSADAAYEWTYYDTRAELYENGKLSYSGVSQEQTMAASAELRDAYGAYVNGLGLKLEDGTALTDGNLRSAIIALLEKELYEALDEVGQEQMLKDLGYGAVPVEIPEFTDEELEAMRVQVEGFGMTLEQYFAYKGWVQPYNMTCEDWEDWYTVDESGSIDFDYGKYLYFVARSTELKVAPAFSNKGMGIALQNEDSLYGTAEYPYSAFEFYSWNHDAVEGNGCGTDDTGLTWDEFMATPAGKELAMQIQMSSPIPYLISETNGDSAPYWYVRHGMVDRDTSFALQTVLYYAMVNDPTIEDVNFEFAWGQPHAGDYDVQEAFAWVDAVMAESAEPAAPATVGGFADVSAGAWYADAVRYVQGKGLMSGTGESSFEPDAEITREQLAAMIFRYAAACGYDVSGRAVLDAFADNASISGYALDAMQWANEVGLISGLDSSTLAPTGYSNRAMLAIILMRFCENIAATTAK